MAAVVSIMGPAGFHEECGIVGVWGHPEAANLAYLALYALQHRGQESAGVVSSDGECLWVHKGMGLVSEVFDQGVLARLRGSSAIGHVRYSTSGASHLRNAQPFVVEHGGGGLAVAHNGNLVNAHLIRAELEARGSLFQSTMDTEVIVHLAAASRRPNLLDRLTEALSMVKGSYSLVLLTNSSLLAARDPHGFRPLVLGRKQDAVVVASESCALDLIEAKLIREVEPGEILEVDSRGARSHKVFQGSPHQCVFELIYFARPDSVVFSRNVYEVRKAMGRALAREHPVEADMVVPVPDSGVPAAIGFAQQCGLPFELGLVRNHYVGRTFIEPREQIRHFGVKVKLNAVKGSLEGKSVVLVDDSIVRGTTSRKLVSLVRQAGARKVHLRISSPPTVGPCHYGIDTPTKEELIAALRPVEEVRGFIGADSLGYLSLEGIREAVGGAGEDFCMACFTDHYPVEIPKQSPAHQLSLFEEM